MEKTGCLLNSLNSFSTFAVSHVRYISKNEQEVYHQFLIFMVECGACELVGNESKNGCQYKSSSYCMEGLQSYSTSMMLNGHYWKLVKDNENNKHIEFEGTCINI